MKSSKLKPTRILLLWAAAALLAGCFKDVSTQTTYVLKPLRQEVSGDVLQPVASARAFAFDADTVSWTVASYEDALNGIISGRYNTEMKNSTPVAVAQPCGPGEFEGRIQMQLNRSSQMVVVVNPVNKLYAYTQQQVAENMPFTYVTLLFKPYREGLVYKEGNWIFCNDFYVPPTYIDCYLVPLRQQEQEGSETAFPVTSADITAYAFSADTTLWKIDSYADASNGILTSKNDPLEKRDNPNFKAYPEEDKFRMSVSSETLMIVIVDRRSTMYAYTKKIIDLHGTPETFSVVFRPWMETYSYEDDGWRVVNDEYKPEDPDDPETAAASLKLPRR